MADPYPLIPMQTRAQLHEWLADNHSSSSGFWLVAWRRAELGTRIEYDDVVEECLCFGWIDSTTRTVDDQRSALRLTPRRPGSGWSRTNKVRLERLQSAGLMQPAGQAVLDQAMQDGSWDLLDDVEDLLVPDDLAVALSEAEATKQWESLTPGRRKQLLWWIKSAKREVTRNDRIARTAAAAAEGRSAVE